MTNKEMSSGATPENPESQVAAETQYADLLDQVIADAEKGRTTEQQTDTKHLLEDYLASRLTREVDWFERTGTPYPAGLESDIAAEIANIDAELSKQIDGI